MTPKNAFQERAQIWRIEEVPVEKLIESIERWEERLDYVEEGQNYRMQEEDKVQALLQFCPATLRMKLMEDQGRGLHTTYDDLREEIAFRVVDIVDNGGAKRVGAVGAPEDSPQGRIRGRWWRGLG